MNTSPALPFSAEVLQVTCPDHLDRLRELRESPGYEVIDAIDAQLKDLVQTRQPGRKMDDAEIQAATALHVSGDVSTYGVWVHYPWAKRVVRTLPEDDFIELRTNRNQQKITVAEQSCLRSKVVGIVGLSVGQSVALTMALERCCGEIRLADFDVIDLSNLNRLRCGIHEIGVPKTIVAARQIAELDPYLNVVCFSDGYTIENSDAFLDGLDLVVDECDSIDIKIELREAARRRGIPVVMNTSDRGMTDIERFDLEPQRPVFHGRLSGLAQGNLSDLTTEEKVPYVMDILGMSSTSVRLRASMLEIQQSIKTWPQLASDVVLGGAIVCDVARRVLLDDEPVVSGRYYMDLSEVGTGVEGVAPDDEPEDAPAPMARRIRGDVVDDIIADAALAPSAGNAQPWVWSRIDGGLALNQRSGGGSSILYHDDKASMVGLGATLETALISAGSRGFALDLQVVDDVDGSPAARLALSPGSAGEDRHFGQIARRRSVRARRTGETRLPDGVMERMAAEVARFPGQELTFLTSPAEIDVVAGLVGEAERLRILDPESHADMMNELAWSEHEHAVSGEGIPMPALGLSPAEVVGLKMLRDPAVIAVLARWDLGACLMQLANELIATSSAVGVLWSRGNDRHDYLQGGRALQRLWLEATNADVGLCPVTPICYLLSAWRAGRPVTERQAEAFPALDRRFRETFNLPVERGDIALFRMVPAARELAGPRLTHRRSATAR